MFVWWSFTSQYPLLHHRPSFKTLSSVLHSHYNPTLCITAHALHYSPPPLHHSPPFTSVSSFPQSHHSPASTSVSSVLPSHHSPPFPSQPPFTSQFPFYIRFPIGLFTSELPFTLVSSSFPLHHSPTLYITVSPLTSVSSVPILQPHFPSQVSLLSQTYLTLLGRGQEVQQIWTGSGAAQLLPRSIETCWASCLVPCYEDDRGGCWGVVEDSEEDTQAAVAVQIDLDHLVMTALYKLDKDYTLKLCSIDSMNILLHRSIILYTNKFNRV